uniref:EEL n=1 Tax=Arundo donax TaxID=35708 RepID=A0A0A9D5F7_ARUDO
MHGRSSHQKLAEFVRRSCCCFASGWGTGRRSCSGGGSNILSILRRSFSSSSRAILFSSSLVYACFLARDLAADSRFLIMRFCRRSTVLSTTPSPATAVAPRFRPPTCERKTPTPSPCASWYTASRADAPSGGRAPTYCCCGGYWCSQCGPAQPAPPSTATPARERKSSSVISPMVGCAPPLALWMSRHTSSTVFLPAVAAALGSAVGAAGSTVRRRSSRFMLRSGSPRWLSTSVSVRPYTDPCRESAPPPPWPPSPWDAIV